MSEFKLNEEERKTIFNFLKKIPILGFLVTAFFISTPQGIYQFIKNVLSTLDNAGKALFARFLELTPDVITALGVIWDYIWKKVKIVFWVSVVIIALFFTFLTWGVKSGNSWMIIIAGFATSVYLFAVSFLLEIIVGLFIGVKDNLLLLPKAILRKLNEKLGLDFGDALPKKDKDPIKKKMQEIRFLAVPFLVFSFWLSLIPNLFVYKYVWIVGLGAFSMASISFWKNRPESKVWLHYRKFQGYILLILAIGFLPCLYIKQYAPEVWNEGVVLHVYKWAAKKWEVQKQAVTEKKKTLSVVTVDDKVNKLLAQAQDKAQTGKESALEPMPEPTRLSDMPEPVRRVRIPRVQPMPLNEHQEDSDDWFERELKKLDEERDRALRELDNE